MRQSQAVAGQSNFGEFAAADGSLREPGSSAASSVGTIDIQLQHAKVHIEGGADPVLLRVLLECLRA
jgi:hypothetical protein